MVRKTGPPILACGLGHGENSPVGCFLTRPFKSHKLQLKIKYSLPTMEKLYFILRKTGLEPVWDAPHAPQTCASASSATSALPNPVSLSARSIIARRRGFVKRFFAFFHQFPRQRLPSA